MSKLATILMALSLTVCAWGFSDESVLVRQPVNLETAFIADGQLYVQVDNQFVAVDELRYGADGKVEAGWVTWKCGHCGYDRNWKIWNWSRCSHCGKGGSRVTDHDSCKDKHGEKDKPKVVIK